MMWTACHWWPVGAYFAFNLYRYIMLILIRRPGELDPENLLIHEGVTKGNPLSMVLYGLRLSVMEEHIWK